ncbi:MAG: hypothetical protein DWQ37_16615 [Planctomycetota bacterium]|nr:MAG: hypothetical protein DWQ37_16615 [Planctomycetota bacterium]
MADSHPTPPDATTPNKGAVDMPRPTAAPIVLAVGIALILAGWALNITFIIVGAVIFVAGLGGWIAQLLPGRGHALEPFETVRGRALVTGEPGRVAQLRQGMPGYRLRMPEKVHPISAGIKGGILGGIIMPLPAMLYGLISGKGIWLPLNLLAGMVLPGVDEMSVEALGQFNLTLAIVGLLIHATNSVTFGLLYGVLLPTLPPISKPLAWGALLMPLLWTVAAFLTTAMFNSQVRELVDWPWFVVSQFIFGVVVALFVMWFNPEGGVGTGAAGGILGGVLMAVPAMLWGYFTGHGIWYPVNLLAVMVQPPDAALTVEALEQYDGTWLLAATAFHGALSLAFGIVYGVLLPRVPAMPGPFAWGALMMPLLWTATSYGLMGVVNPVLQDTVDWPWFVVSQFVFGLVAAIVVVRSEQVYVTPAGRGQKPSGEAAT